MVSGVEDILYLTEKHSVPLTWRKYKVNARENKGGRELIPPTYLFPWVICPKLFYIVFAKEIDQEMENY